MKDLGGRILPFDAAAAARYSEIVVNRRRAGAPIEAFDALIAATASVAGRRSRHAGYRRI